MPLLVHGVALGPASTAPVDARRLDRLARLVERLEPAFWSEHLACVRAGDIEIGHLAAAPRTSATIDATAANLSRARRSSDPAHGREHRDADGSAGQRSL